MINYKRIRQNILTGKECFPSPQKMPRLLSGMSVQTLGGKRMSAQNWWVKNARKIPANAREQVLKNLILIAEARPGIQLAAGQIRLRKSRRAVLVE